MDGKRAIGGDIGVSHSGGVDLILEFLDLMRGFGEGTGFGLLEEHWAQRKDGDVFTVRG